MFDVFMFSPSEMYDRAQVASTIVSTSLFWLNILASTGRAVAKRAKGGWGFPLHMLLMVHVQLRNNEIVAGF